MSPRTLGLLAFWLLFALQWVWHLWWLPPARGSALLPLALFALPLLPPAIGLLRRTPNALFWAALVSLLHVCHAIAELWAAPATRVAAAIELALALLLISAVGIDGLRRRRAARRVPPAAE
jgi:uncharacterized membrane protein